MDPYNTLTDIWSTGLLSAFYDFGFIGQMPVLGLRALRNGSDYWRLSTFQKDRIQLEDDRELEREIRERSEVMSEEINERKEELDRELKKELEREDLKKELEREDLKKELEREDLKKELEREDLKKELEREEGDEEVKRDLKGLQREELKKEIERLCLNRVFGERVSVPTRASMRARREEDLGILEKIGRMVQRTVVDGMREVLGVLKIRYERDISWLQTIKREQRRRLEEIKVEERRRLEKLRGFEVLTKFQKSTAQKSLCIDNKLCVKKFLAAGFLQLLGDWDGGLFSDFSVESETLQRLLHRSRQFLHQLLLEILLEKLFRCVVITAAVIICLFEYLMGYIERGGWATYCVTTWEFRATYMSIELRLASYFWFKFRAAPTKKIGQKRSKDDLMGQPTIGVRKGKFLPRLKAYRGSEDLKRDVGLGSYDTYADASNVFWIGAWYFNELSRFTDEVQSYLDGLNLPPCPTNLGFYGKAQWIREKGYLNTNDTVLVPETIREEYDAAEVSNPGQHDNNQELRVSDYSDGSGGVGATDGAASRMGEKSSFHQQPSEDLVPSHEYNSEWAGAVASVAEHDHVRASANQPQAPTNTRYTLLGDTILFTYDHLDGETF